MNSEQVVDVLKREILKYQRDNTKATSFIEVKPRGKDIRIEAKIDGFIDIDQGFATSISKELQRRFEGYLKTQPCVVTLHMTFLGGKANSFALIYACENDQIDLVYRINHELSNY